jgi:hypothetical protein
VLWGVVGYCQIAGAQVPSPTNFAPKSDTGGFTGQALNQIYRSDIGQGFNISSLNQLALQNARAQVPYVGQSTSTRIPSGPVGGAPQRSSKPFSSFSPSPTTSPYLNLFREDIEGGGDFNYQTLVRPQLQQQQFNQQIERQNLEISRRLQAYSAQGAFRPEGDRNQIPTGHRSMFLYFSHFHPSAGPRRGR